MSPNATNVQRITPNISNLHFHANSEHTRDGAPSIPAAHILHLHETVTELVRPWSVSLPAS